MSFSLFLSRYAAISISENEDGKRTVLPYNFEKFLALQFFNLLIKKIVSFFSGTLNEVKEMKGLDIVRRDWCDLAKDAGK